MALTKEQTKAKLREFYDRYGYIPSKTDLCPPPDGWPWYQVICRKFGNFDELLQETFDEEYEHLKQRTKHRRYRKHRQEMRKILRQEYWEETLRLGYPPTISQIAANPNMHSISAYYKYWGMRALLKSLELEGSYRRPRGDGREYTDEYLLTALQDKYRRDGEVPTYRGVTQDYQMPSAQIYTTRFQCSWSEVLRLAKITPVSKNTFRMGLSDDKMLGQLRKLAKLLGHTPTTAEVNSSAVTPRSETYREHFGSFYQALLAAGLQPTPRQSAAHRGGLAYWRQHPKTQP